MQLKVHLCSCSNVSGIKPVERWVAFIWKPARQVDIDKPGKQMMELSYVGVFYQMPKVTPFLLRYVADYQWATKFILTFWDGINCRVLVSPPLKIDIRSNFRYIELTRFTGKTNFHFLRNMTCKKFQQFKCNVYINAHMEMTLGQNATKNGSQLANPGAN